MDYAPTSVLDPKNIPVAGANTTFEYRLQGKYDPSKDVDIALANPALVNAESLDITALTAGKELPSGILLHFSGGAGKPDIVVEVLKGILAADAVRNLISIAPLTTALTGTATATWQGYYYPPLQQEITLQQAGSQTAIQVHSASAKVFDYVTKTGNSWSLNFKSHVQVHVKGARDLIDAGDFANGVAEIANVRVRDASGNWRFGDVSIINTTQATPNRGPQMLDVSTVGQGALRRRYITDNAA